MEKLVVVFDARVAKDASQAGILGEGDRLMVVASGKEVERATSAVINGDHSVIVANEAPLEAIVAMVAAIAETKGNVNGEGLCDCRRGTSREYWFEAKWEVVLIRPDGIDHLAGDRIVGQTNPRPAR